MTAATIALTIIGLFLLLIFIIIAVRIGVSRESSEPEEQKPVIHASGIYSVVRKSPRNDVLRIKPTPDELRKYLAVKNEDYNGRRLDTGERELLVTAFSDALEQQLKLIEDGDKEGAEFYYYSFEWTDPVCAENIIKGQFVTREDIFTFPVLVPPFHIGCGCRLMRHQGGEKLKDTTEFGLRPFVQDESIAPQVPEWKTILKLPRG